MCTTSNSDFHIKSFSSFYHSILLFRHQFFKPGTLDNNKLVCAFPFLQHFIHPEQTRTLARHNKQPSSNNRGIFFTLNSMKSRNYHSIFISKLLTDWFKICGKRISLHSWADFIKKEAFNSDNDDSLLTHMFNNAKTFCIAILKQIIPSASIWRQQLTAERTS